MADYQPNSDYCFVCGVKNEAGLRARFMNDGAGKVRLDTRICEKHQGFPGIAHGGICATILDETMGRAALSGDPNRLFFTAKMEIRYRQHVPLDTDITVYGRILKDRGRAATAEGEIVLPDGSIAVQGTATLFSVPQEEIEKMLQHPKTAWRVYNNEEFEKALRDDE